MKPSERPYRLTPFFLIGFTFLFMTTAHTDTYTKARMMNGMTETKTWTGGSARRIESGMNGLGRQILITRLDRGVEWTIDPDLGAYDEKPIAMPYNPKQTTGADYVGAAQDGMEGFTKEAVTAPGQNCAQFAKNGESRQFAGFQAEGYHSDCPNNLMGGATFWIAQAKGPLEQYKNDIEKFEKKYSELKFSKFPVEEQKKILENTQMFAGMMMPPTIVSAGKNPFPSDGIALAMSGSMPDQQGNKTEGYTLEITEVHAGAVKPSLFELPANLQKVPNLAEVKMKQMSSQWQQQAAAAGDAEQGMPPGMQEMMGQMGGGAPQNTDPQQMMDQTKEDSQDPQEPSQGN